MKQKVEWPEKELNKLEVNNLTDDEFRVMVIRMLMKFSENYKQLHENYKELNENYNGTRDTVHDIRAWGRGDSLCPLQSRTPWGMSKCQFRG